MLKHSELTGCLLGVCSVTSRFLKEGVLHSCRGLTKLNLSRTNVGDKGKVVMVTLAMTVGVLVVKVRMSVKEVKMLVTDTECG